MKSVYEKIVYIYGKLVDRIKASATDKLGKSEPVSWAELKTLRDRDGGNLVPGQQYRITDYVATTNGNMKSQSANHPFDIIVTADDERTLNEHARAIMHDGDLPDDIVNGETRTKYFAGCDLAAWDVWYCLDNDTSRFAWADSANGKGVIYRLVDEWQNDVGFDFKGIVFQKDGGDGVVYALGNGNVLGFIGEYDASLAGGVSGCVVRCGPVRNFVSKSHVTIAGGCHDNVVNAVRTVLGVECHDNVVLGVRDVYIGPKSSGNSMYGWDIRLGTKCTGNTIARQGERVESVTLGDACADNVIAQHVYSAVLGDGCTGNTVGENCISLRMGNYCANNNIGMGDASTKRSVELGDECDGNYLGGGCKFVTLGSGCSAVAMFSAHDITIGDECGLITFGRTQLATYARNGQYEAGTHLLHEGRIRRCAGRYIGEQSCGGEIGELFYNRNLGYLDSGYHRSLLRYAGGFKDTNTYQPGDVVLAVWGLETAQRGLYKCVVAHTGEWDAADFEVVCLQGEHGAAEGVLAEKVDLSDVLVDAGYADAGLVASCRRITVGPGVGSVAIYGGTQDSPAAACDVTVMSGISGVELNVGDAAHTVYQAEGTATVVV